MLDMRPVIVSLMLVASTVGASARAQARGAYAAVNGLRIYYEIHGPAVAQ